MSIFDALAKKQELEIKIDDLNEVKDHHVQNAEYTGAAAARDAVERLRAELTECKQATATLDEVDRILDLMQAFMARIRFGDLAEIFADESFNDLLPLLNYLLGPNFKLAR